MFTVGLVGVMIVCLVIWLVGDSFGSRRLEQQERELELLTLRNDLEKERLRNELSHKKELESVAKGLIADEKYYMEGLQDEIKRLESNLNNMELQQIPTREQLDTWLFTLKADNRLSNQKATEIMKLYDIKRMYPESKV